VVERVIGTLKREGLRRIVVAYHRDALHREPALLMLWYNEHRPHEVHDGATPNEAYEGRRPANRNPRIEPRPRWPRPSPCTGPQTSIAGQPGGRCELVVDFLEGRRHLPLVTLKRTAYHFIRTRLRRSDAKKLRARALCSVRILKERLAQPQVTPMSV
jgi:hypothetical protein